MYELIKKAEKTYERTKKKHTPRTVPKPKGHKEHNSKFISKDDFQPKQLKQKSNIKGG